MAAPGALFRCLVDGPLSGAVPAIVAGPGDSENAIARPVLEALPGAIDRIGRFSLPEIAAFLSRTALFVSNDSGLMHTAAAFSRPGTDMLSIGVEDVVEATVTIWSFVR
ncbi:MAG: hypothetical protein EXR07_02195 [Acetobacteraceae bacterium]|nr:hypothetical protein [Acetobacteraceae bacterium]